MHDSTMITVIPGCDGGRIVYCPDNSAITLRVRTTEECREAGIDPFPAEWLYSIIVADGTEHLIPAAGAVVRYGAPPASLVAAGVRGAAL